MVVSAIEGHRLWASTYDLGLNPLLALEERILPTIRASRVIDVACGTGRWTTRLNAFGVDRCEEMLRAGSRKPGMRGRLLLADASALPFASGISDLTLCSFGVGYIQNIEAAVGEMARITRPGGQVVISDLHPAAIAAGWTRSFRTNGTVYEMEYRPTAVDEARHEAQRYGLKLMQHHDACFGEPERHIFDAAGKSLEDFGGTPAVWLDIWTKP